MDQLSTWLIGLGKFVVIIGLLGGLVILAIQIKEAWQKLNPKAGVAGMDNLPEVIKAVLGGPTWFILFACGAALVAGGVWIQALIVEKKL